MNKFEPTCNVIEGNIVFAKINVKKLLTHPVVVAEEKMKLFPDIRSINCSRNTYNSGGCSPLSNYIKHTFNTCITGPNKYPINEGHSPTNILPNIYENNGSGSVTDRDMQYFNKINKSKSTNFQSNYYKATKRCKYSKSRSSMPNLLDNSLNQPNNLFKSNKNIIYYNKKPITKKYIDKL